MSIVIVDGETWELLGAGETLQHAIEDAEDTAAEETYEGPRCPHCGRYAEEPDRSKWRAYPITREGFDLLMSSGWMPDDMIDPDATFRWDDVAGAFVVVDNARCIRCRGRGRLRRESQPPRTPTDPCDACDSGYLEHEGIEFIAPPESACVWRP